MNSRVPLAIFLFIFIALALLYGRAVIQNDGITYYSLTRSLIHDGDFNLSNEAELFRDLRVFNSSKTGRIASTYSCGFAFLYVPFLIATGLFSSLNELRPYAQNATFPFTDSLGIFIGTVSFAIITIFLAYKMLRNFEVKSGPAIFISFAIFIGTPFIFYTFTTPSFIHASDAFLISAVFYCAIRKDPKRFEKAHLRYVLVGAFLGFSVLLRNINAFLIPPVLIGILYFDRNKGRKYVLISLAEIFAGGFPFLLIQLGYNWSQYGQILTTGYNVPVTDEINDFLKMFRSLKNTLIHPSIGLFIWSPVTILSVIGLILGCMKRREPAILATLCILFVIGSIAFFRIFSPGASFGNRYLTQLYIFWVIGFYEIYRIWERPVISMGTVLALWFFILINAYYINFASSVSRRSLSDVRSVTPVKVLETAKNSYSEQGSKISPFLFWYRSLQAAPYPTLHALIWHPESRYQIRQEKRKSGPL